LLLGPNIGWGDDAILKIIEATGSEVVIEEICEGIRYYWNDIENKGDPIRSLAKGYLVDRVPCAFMRHSARKRLDFALKLIDDFKVTGIIWYELLCCETYDSEAYFFTEKMAERGIPMLTLESDYTTAATGQFKTRLQAFTEIVTGSV
jgi:benzoyl-CoA reductase/2-hydroxyglutaryl-CoA dehydratase subunit BcrC/BadD/HgdB